MNKKADEYLLSILTKSQQNLDSFDDDGEYVGHDTGFDDDDPDPTDRHPDDDDDDDPEDKTSQRLAYHLYMNAVVRSIILNSNQSVPTSLDTDVAKTILQYWNISHALDKVQ